MINDSSRSTKVNLNLIAGNFENEMRSDPMMTCPVWICKLHAGVTMQKSQSANESDEDDVAKAKDDDSREEKPAVADVMSQISKPRFVVSKNLGSTQFVPQI